MKKPTFFWMALTATFFFSGLLATACARIPESSEGNEYIVVIEGYDWGPAVSKVILSLEEPVSTVNKDDFVVTAKRSTPCTDLSPALAAGARAVIYAYVSDAKGDIVDSGKYITLVLFVGPNVPIASPIQYTRNDQCRGNNWVDYQLSITNTSTHQLWNKERDRIMPIIDQFDLSGRYVYDDDLTMSYASFVPETGNRKVPLIIWLHGGGEGGTDPTIPLVANRAANYASDEIQRIFGGAYVLVPQCPGAWMHNAQGVTTRGRENDIYNEGLMALIKDYVADHPNIDTDRIYLGGCSNGGYMTLKLILLYPDYFAAGFPSALAYNAEYISDEQIQSIKNVPIWFIHSKDDPVTPPDQTVVPVYKRLIAAGAPDVYFSYYDHVVDITGFFGGENYQYSGHWSWIYSHANHCKLDYDGKPVMINGKAVTIMEWLAEQSR